MEGTLEEPMVKDPSHDNRDVVKDAVIPNGVNGNYDDNDKLVDASNMGSDGKMVAIDSSANNIEDSMEILDDEEEEEEAIEDDEEEYYEEDDDVPDNESIPNERLLNRNAINSRDRDNKKGSMTRSSPLSSSSSTTVTTAAAATATTATGVVSDENNISEVSNKKEACKNNSVESMEVDNNEDDEHGSDVEFIDDSVSDIHTVSDNELDKHYNDKNINNDDVEEREMKSDGSDEQQLNDSIVSISSVETSDLKICEENGSVGSPDIEEITENKSNGHNSLDERSPKEQKAKKVRKQLDLSNITPRRSSRNIKRTSYIEKEPEEEVDPEGSSDIEEIKPEDPLACIDGKDKENSKLKSPIKTSKTTIVVNDTKRLVEIAAGSKASKGGKKEPTLVIIDTNSILSGRGGVPVTSNKSSSHHHHHHHHHHSITSSSSFSMMPVGMGSTQTIYPNMRTTITPVPMSSKTAQLSAKISSSITAVPTPAPPPPPPQILPTLTDDMFVVEAPSFIVPYVYEKPPIKPLKEFVTKLEKSIDEHDRKSQAMKKESGKNKMDCSNKDDSSESGKNDSEGEESVESHKKESDIGDSIDLIDKSYGGDTDKLDDKNKVMTYFDLPLGKFFMQIGINLVQEFVQTDLLRTQKRRQGKSGTSAETQMAINSLIKNLEFSKENNEPFHLEMKKCEFCNFKTESALVMQHHLETPHMRNYVYKCNFCPLEVRSPHDILFHMEAEHNTRGRLERGPAFHQCPNCPFEDNQKGKLTRHILACTKKFRPERNLEPTSDWEPPAKIPRLNRARHVGPVNTSALAMAMSAKGQQPLLPKLLPAPSVGRGRGRPPMQPRYSDIKSLRPGSTSTRQDPSGMMYRPTSSGLLVPTSYQFGGNQIFQNTTVSSKSPTAKLLSQPSISITPLPRTTTQTPVSGTGSSSKPGGKNTFVICEICDGYIKDLEQLRNHMQWIHKVKIHPKMIYNRPPLNCQKCQFRFFTDQGLERHLLGSHGLVTSSMQEAANKGKDAGRCPACGRVYQWKLLNHVARDHGMTLKPAHLSYKCTVCTATFGMYKQFENHVYSAHSVVAKRVMDKKNTPSSPSSRSCDSLLKPLKINDEITIIPQPAKATRSSSSSQGRSK